MFNLIAIDPGKKGGLAIGLYDEVTDTWSYAAGNLPEDLINNPQLLKQELKAAFLLDLLGPWKVYIEKVPSFVGRAVPGHTSFLLGKSAGMIEGVVSGMGLDYELVTPQAWLKGVGAGKRNKRSDTAWKNHLKDLAIELFGETVTPTLATADALLILRHAQIVEGHRF